MTAPQAPTGTCAADVCGTGRRTPRAQVADSAFPVVSDVCTCAAHLGAHVSTGEVCEVCTPLKSTGQPHTSASTPPSTVLFFAAVTSTGGTYGTGPRRDGWAAGHGLRLTAGRRRHKPPSAMKNYNNNPSRHHDGTGARLPGSTALRGRPTDARLVSRGAVREATCGPQDRVRAHVPQDDAVTMTQDPTGDRMTAIAGVHPYAEQFPMLPDDELADLTESIRANGLRQPIVVTPDGLVLDGRNRWAACQRAGVEPATVVHEGDPAQCVIDANVRRRHMTTGAARSGA